MKFTAYLAADAACRNAQNYIDGPLITNEYHICRDCMQFGALRTAQALDHNPNDYILVLVLYQTP
jgi:hypothetical protein